MILLQLSSTVNIRIPFHMRLEWYYSWDSSPVSLVMATRITHVYMGRFSITVHFLPGNVLFQGGLVGL